MIEGLDLHLRKDMEYIGIMFIKISCDACMSGAAVYICSLVIHGEFLQGLTHSTNVHRFCTSHKTSHMGGTRGRVLLVLSEAALKVHKLLGAPLPDLLDNWTIGTNIFPTL